MGLSKRHHYIPKFFIKGFCGSDQLLSVFDLKTRRLWKNRASTKQVFFEINRNLFEIEGTKTDYVELLYQKIDDIFAPVYKRIVHEQATDMSMSDLMHIILFIGMMYWRIPKTDQDIKDHVGNLTRDNVRFQIIDKETKEDAPIQTYREFMSDLSFIESYRTMKPLFDYLESEENRQLEDWKIYFSNKPNQVHLIGDNPIVLKEENVENIFKNELIFPLSKNKAIYHTNGKLIREISPDSRVKLDLLIILQSEQYVCGPNGDYLEHVAKIAHNYNTPARVQALKSEVFEIFGD